MCFIFFCIIILYFPYLNRVQNIWSSNLDLLYFFIAMFFFRRVCVQRFAPPTDRHPAAVLKHFLSILKKKHGIDVRDEPDHSPHPRK